MAGWGRRFAVRAGSGGFMAAVALGSAVAPGAAANPLQMTMQLGYHDTGKLGEWMPVTIDVTNGGADVDGTLQVQASNSFGAKGGGPPGGAAIYQMPLSLASGSTKHFRTFISVDYPGTIDARIVAGRRVIAT